jgi:hypothetical protein
MLKPFSLIFFVVVMVWLGSIFVSTDPQVRLERSCSPVVVMDRVGTSAMQVLHSSWGPPTHEFFGAIHYGCRYVVWSVFYEDDWRRAQQGFVGQEPIQP